MKVRGIVVLLVLTLAVFAATLAGCGEKAKEAVSQLPDSAELSQLTDAIAVMGQSSTYESVDSIKAAWSGVESAYDDFVKAAQDKQDIASDKLTDLQAAFDGLKAAIANLGSDQSLSEKVATVKAAVEVFNYALGQL